MFTVGGDPHMIQSQNNQESRIRIRNTLAGRMGKNWLFMQIEYKGQI